MCVSSRSRQHAIRCKKIVNIKSSAKWPWLKTYKITKRLILVTTDLRLYDIFFQFIEKNNMHLLWKYSSLHVNRTWQPSLS